MDSPFVECPTCGKLFAPVKGKTLCSRCTTREIDLSDRIEDAVRRGYETTEDIAQFVGASPHDVHRILRDSSFLSHAVRDEIPCHRCGEAPALPTLEYCARCQKALSSHVQRAVDALRAQVEQMGSEPPFERDLTNSDPSGMKSELAHKRRRRLFYRKSPTVRNRWSS